MFCFHDVAGRVGVAFTDRRGGVSAPPYDALNLGTATADDPGSVARNYDLVAEALALDPGSLALMHQVHGSHVEVVDAATSLADLPEADALVTVRPRLALTVRVADCVPVLLGDDAAGVVACAHAGRNGLASGVVPQAVRTMRGLGADRVRAWVGPYVCGACYEVPQGLQEEVAAVVPESRTTTTWGTPGLDIGAGVRAQLSAEGCEVAATPARCTREDPLLYSHRRDGARSGRAAGVVWLEA